MSVRTRTTLCAAITAGDTQRVQEELDVPRHSLYIIRTDRHRTVVPNDDGELSVRLAGTLKSASHGQRGERGHIESYIINPLDQVEMAGEGYIR
jgi:hypothetical protein